MDMGVLPQKRGNFLQFDSGIGIVVGVAVTEKTRSLSVFLRVETSPGGRQNCVVEARFREPI